MHAAITGPTAAGSFPSAGGAGPELERAYLEARRDPAFIAELEGLLRNYVGRETPLMRRGG